MRAEDAMRAEEALLASGFYIAKINSAAKEPTAHFRGRTYTGITEIAEFASAVKAMKEPIRR